MRAMKAGLPHSDSQPPDRPKRAPNHRRREASATFFTHCRCEIYDHQRFIGLVLVPGIEIGKKSRKLTLRGLPADRATLGQGGVDRVAWV